MMFQPRWSADRWGCCLLTCVPAATFAQQGTSSGARHLHPCDSARAHQHTQCRWVCAECVMSDKLHQCVCSGRCVCECAAGAVRASVQRKRCGGTRLAAPAACNAPAPKQVRFRAELQALYISSVSP